MGVVEQLVDALGAKVVVDDDLMTSWTRDQSPFAEAGRPIAVVRAEAVDDVVASIQAAARTGTPFVVRGAGTGLSGGANASAGCIVLSVERMNEIIAIDPVRRTATVQPGVINGDLARAVAEHGLRYTPDPGSRDISSIGGNVATNAGGMSCCKYGVTADHVAALTAVLPTGEIIRTGGTTRKNVTGLDLTRLLVGSEGTLAVVVEVTVWLRPAEEQESTLVATFRSLRESSDAVVALTRAAAPSAVELMDRTTVSAVNSMTGMGIDEEAESVLLITFDGPAASTEALLGERVMLEHGAADVFRTDDAEEGAELMAARRMALPALERFGSILLDDIGVPVDQLPDVVADIQAIGVEHGVTIGTFGHAADGNLHPTIIYDAQFVEQRERALAAFSAIVAAAVARGGTVTGEHGVGSLKLPFVSQMYSEAEVALMHRVKAAFDPDGILNPGRGY